MKRLLLVTMTVITVIIIYCIYSCNSGDGKKENPPSKRLFLHAYQIEFEHPITKGKCLFTAPLPKGFDEKREGMER